MVQNRLFKWEHRFLMLLFSLVMVFHLLVVVGLVPFEIVWGGKLKTREEMHVFEGISLILNALMLSFVAADYGLFRITPSKGTRRFLFGLMSVLFALNTVGNLFSDNHLEKLIFTPLTFITAIVTARLALKNDR